MAKVAALAASASLIHMPNPNVSIIYGYNPVYGRTVDITRVYRGHEYKWKTEGSHSKYGGFIVGKIADTLRAPKGDEVVQGIAFYGTATTPTFKNIRIKIGQMIPHYIVAKKAGVNYWIKLTSVVADLYDPSLPANNLPRGGK
jgi:hypothetical protein